MNDYPTPPRYRIAGYLAVFAIVAAAWILAAPAQADEPPTLTGRVGCVVTWNYNVEQEQFLAGFPFWIDGQWRKLAPASARSMTCDEIGMSTPGTYRMELFARAKPDSGFSNSVRVPFVIVLEPGKSPPASEPTEIKLIMPSRP